MIASLRRDSVRLWTRTFSVTSIPRFFQNVEQAPKDPILGITENFLADKNVNTKMNLGVVRFLFSLKEFQIAKGAYRDDEGKPVVLQCVREAEQKIAGKHFMELRFVFFSVFVFWNRYLPIGGLKEFCSYSLQLAFSPEIAGSIQKHVAGIQTLSGTGSNPLFSNVPFLNQAPVV